jgi:hypothetical protein
VTVIRTLTSLCIAVTLASPASADGLLGKISKGASNAATTVGNAAKNVGQSIDSTGDLVAGEGSPEATREKLDAMSTDTLDRLFSENPDAADLFARSAGYAVFDTRRLVALGVATGYGRGVAVSRITGDRIYMKMGTGGIGLSLGIGGFETQVVILFEDTDRFEAFISYGFDAAAETSAMFGADKADEALHFVDGRSFFFLTKKGWKVSA